MFDPALLQPVHIDNRLLQVIHGPLQYTKILKHILISQPNSIDPRTTLHHKTIIASRLRLKKVISSPY